MKDVPAVIEAMQAATKAMRDAGAEIDSLRQIIREALPHLDEINMIPTREFDAYMALLERMRAAAGEKQ